MDARLVVVLVILGLGLFQVVAGVLLIRRWRTRSDRFLADFRAEASLSGERFVVGPERALYRGGTGGYSKVKGNGTIILTDRRLVFRKLTGGVVEVPRPLIVGIRTPATLDARAGGLHHLVVATTAPAELGFFVKDVTGWERALGGRR